MFTLNLIILYVNYTSILSKLKYKEVFIILMAYSSLDAPHFIPLTS